MLLPSGTFPINEPYHASRIGQRVTEMSARTPTWPFSWPRSGRMSLELDIDAGRTGPRARSGMRL
jgi:hypothetical protein